MADDGEDAPQAVEVEAPSDEKSLESALEARIAETEKFIAQSNFVKALQTALSDPPVGTKNQELKNKAVDNMMAAISRIKEADIPKMAADFTQDDCDTMMKFIVRGFERSPKQSPVLLKWHAAVVEKAGIGCIMRALTSKKTV